MQPYLEISSYNVCDHCGYSKITIDVWLPQETGGIKLLGSKTLDYNHFLSNLELDELRGFIKNTLDKYDLYHFYDPIIDSESSYWDWGLKGQ